MTTGSSTGRRVVMIMILQCRRRWLTRRHTPPSVLRPRLLHRRRRPCPPWTKMVIRTVPSTTPALTQGPQAEVRHPRSRSSLTRMWIGMTRILRWKRWTARSLHRGVMDRERRCRWREEKALEDKDVPTRRQFLVRWLKTMMQSLPCRCSNADVFLLIFQFAFNWGGHAGWRGVTPEGGRPPWSARSSWLPTQEPLDGCTEPRHLSFSKWGESLPCRCSNADVFLLIF
mmetsp:Transcript_12553/g.28016  ORF Transcript_12553/g.28016 Transcript_12553/m.28016 type:complete len:228 (+) Transcript_12553:1484-2167(+)